MNDIQTLKAPSLFNKARKEAPKPKKSEKLTVQAPWFLEKSP